MTGFQAIFYTSAFCIVCCCAYIIIYNKREREQAVHQREREKKRMRENIIVANKDNTKRMTTRERQHIEVAKLEAELNALKVDAFAKVRLMRLFF